MEKISVAPPLLPEDLQSKVNALKALVGLQKLLHTGSFLYTARAEIDRGLAFLESLHKDLLLEAMQHTEADLVPEFIDLKKMQEQEAKTKEEEKIHELKKS